MSRIGKMPITIPAGVDITIGENNVVTVKGAQGTLVQTMPADMIIRKTAIQSLLSVRQKRKRIRHCTDLPVHWFQI